MSVLVWLAANIVMVVFIIKMIKEKDSVTKKRNRNIWLISLGVAVVFFFVIAGEGAKSKQSDATDDAVLKSEQQETSKELTQIESGIASDNSKESSESIAASSENTQETSEDFLIELNTLQVLFASLTVDTTREEINTYITENNLAKYAFTHDSGYYIGYEYSAIRARGRDREGEAVDINFVTSGNKDKIGKVSSAEYCVHNKGISDRLKFKDGEFYYNSEKCKDGEEAVRKFIEANGQTTLPELQDKSIQETGETKQTNTSSGNAENFDKYDNKEQQNTTDKYVLNTNTMKIHHPNCDSVAKIKPENYKTTNESIEELEKQGYKRCGICFK